ncbi:hypothetical protein V2J09_001613 [Rumex salicifolius]
MSGRKLYKTKLCLLYQRGRCWRQTCSFAHGDTEIRQFAGSFDDRQDSRATDSRDRHSSQHKYSPEKTMETLDAVHGHSPLLSFKRRRKSKLVDGQSNISGGARVSDGTEAQEKEVNILSSDSRVILKKQLKQVKFDIDLLENQKSKLKTGLCPIKEWCMIVARADANKCAELSKEFLCSFTFSNFNYFPVIDPSLAQKAELEERAQEADSLSSRIQDLEAQLSEEKEHCMRIASKNKKFIKSQNNCTRLQHEFKRQVRLDKVVEELDLDALQLYTNEEDSSINIVSDGETTANHMVNQDLEKRKDIVSFANKKLHINIEAEEGSRSVSLAKRNLFVGEKSLSRRRVDHIISNGRNESEIGNKRKDAERRQSNEGRPKRKRDGFKVSGSDKLLPSTSMAAHPMDGLEAEERADMVQTVPAVAEEEAACVNIGFSIPLPPLPLYSQNNYSQYEGEDEYVNVDELEEDLVEVDIV